MPRAGAENAAGPGSHAQAAAAARPGATAARHPSQSRSARTTALQDCKPPGQGKKRRKRPTGGQKRTRIAVVQDGDGLWARW
jgi:hypothetical protein